MAGSFVKGSVRPQRPGAYFDFIAQTAPPVLDNPSGVVALPFTHTWGPENSVVNCGTLADFLQTYGQGGSAPYSPGYVAVVGALSGEAIVGRPGAGNVLAYRMVGSGGVASSHAFTNTTPAAAITLTARYKGTFGNNISVAIVVNAKDNTKNDLNIYVNSVLVETWTHAATNITALAASINAALPLGSAWVVASAVTSGVALTAISSPVSLGSGNDGATLVSGDWTAAMTAFDTQRFGVFAPFDLADTGSGGASGNTAILAAMQVWSAAANAKGKRFMTITGGGSSDTATTAAARALALNDPNFMTLGIGTYTDAVFGTLTTSQLAPRVAGIYAGRGENQSLSFARLAGLTILSGASDSDLQAALTSGFIAIARDSNVTAPVRLDKAVTSFTTTTDVSRPQAIYSVPKFMKTMHGIEIEVTTFSEANVIGLLGVSDSTRDYIVGQMKATFKQRELNQIIQAGWTIGVDQNPPPAPTDDFISIVYTLVFTRGLEQVLNTVTVG